MWVECLCPVLLWFDCCARAYWSQLGKCMSCQMSVRSTWHLTSHFFGNLLVCFSLQLGAQWGKRWGNDRNAVTFVLSESCSPRGALRGLHPQLNKTERYWEILRACHVKLQNRTYTCKFFNRWNFQFELFCRICQNSKRIQAKRTHTHCLEVSLCLEGLFLPSVSLSIWSSKTHPTSMALCALVANWPNEMHLPPALGRYIPCQCTYLLRQKASFFATKPVSLLDPKCNQSWTSFCSILLAQPRVCFEENGQNLNQANTTGLQHSTFSLRSPDETTPGISQSSANR